MTRVLFISWHPDDPWGYLDSSRVSPQPTPITARIISDNGDGTHFVEAYVEGDRVQFERCAEGDQPGQWRQLSHISSTILATLKTEIQALRSDSDPAVSKMADAVVAMISGADIVQTVQALRTAMNNISLDGTTRSLTLLALALIISEERERA